MDIAVKTCSRCGQEKPLDSFKSRGGKKKHLKVSWCDDCRKIQNQISYSRLSDDPRFMEAKREYAARWAKENPEQYRHNQLLWRYGITLEQYEEILSAQGGVCAICGERPEHKRLAVDHDHETGLVRGLLCEACNHGLGKFKDDTGRLQAAIDYLEAHHASIS